MKSRHGDIRTVLQIDENTYSIEGKSRYFRRGLDFIDFEGGPFVGPGFQFVCGSETVSVENIIRSECVEGGFGEGKILRVVVKGSKCL